MIAKSLDIEGPVGNPIVISGNHVSSVFSSGTQVFQIESGTAVTLSGLTITNGAAFIAGEGGGGILNLGTLTVSHCTLSDNTAGQGGGIFNGGTLTVSHSTLSNNSASENASPSGRKELVLWIACLIAGWKSTVLPGGVLAIASRSEPGPASPRLVTVLGT